MHVQQSPFGRCGDAACFVCGDYGHVARCCPHGTQRLCYNCKRPGHHSKDCPSPPTPRTCYTCGGSGHITRQCTKPPVILTPRLCNGCGERGHLARYCLTMHAGNRQCYRCGSTFHLKRRCRGGPCCYLCRDYGHCMRTCPTLKPTRVRAFTDIDTIVLPTFKDILKEMNELSSRP